MAVRFRNLSTTPDDAISTWPSEAVLTVLERGDLGDLRRLRDAIAVDPWGPIARKTEEVLSHTRPYGVAELMDSAIARARVRAEADERATVAAELRGLIELSGLSRADFAGRVGTSRSRLSTYASGKVVPAATLMVRARRVAESSAAASTR